MFVGFDYGSANCAIGVMNDSQVTLVPLEKDNYYLSSTLYAYDRDLIAEAVYRQLPEEFKREYALSRSVQLAKSPSIKSALDLTDKEQTVFFGDTALHTYLDLPEEGFYVRSPKSFLGATGLRPEQIALFEDIVTLMMQHIKSTADKSLLQMGHTKATHAVIGRPVNFQGIGGEASNRQAEAILSIAASRAGYSEVSFLYEPLAAAMDFETQLQQDKIVLVVDVGGGTTDCSIVKMGPNHILKKDRSDDFLAHSGQRIGGNDLDIALAMHGLMPLMGSKSHLVTGKPMPNKPFWNAVAVNDISAQRDFSTLSTKKLIEELITDACEPELLRHLLKVQQHKLSYQLVRYAERAKIALSHAQETDVILNDIDSNLMTSLNNQQFNSATESILNQVQKLIVQVIELAEVAPDLIYVTGGSAKSPIVYNKIAEVLPHCPIVMGDNFGSVTAGLTRWAEKLFSNN